MDRVSAFNDFSGEYDDWFEKNEQTYRAEIDALRRLFPRSGNGLEVGIGTGRFSIPLDIRIGVEPSANMLRFAHDRNITVCQAVGERLPFQEGQFDFALLVTVICFVKDTSEFLREVRRVIKPGGALILAFIDRDSALGKVYETRKASDKFYKTARFYSTPEIIDTVSRVGFTDLEFSQTILGLPNGSADVYQTRDGYGTGAFVVVSAKKTRS